MRALDAPVDRVIVVPNGVDCAYFQPTGAPRDPATVIFVGRMGYHANVAAARELLTAIMPRVWSRHPAARLLIVGANPPSSLRALAAAAGRRVEVTGYVPDVRPYLARATVSVSPLPYAVGIQNKVLEAMAMTTPVVATPAACAALSATPHEQLLVAAEAREMADGVIRLIDDPVLARRLGTAGGQYVQRTHDWRRIGTLLEQLYRQTIDGWQQTPSRAAGFAS